MSIETIDQQIAKQQERLKQLKAQKQAVIARQKAKVTKQQRTDDTRRKILIGAYMQDMVKTNEQAKILMNGLPQWLKKIVTVNYLRFDFLSCSSFSVLLQSDFLSRH